MRLTNLAVRQQLAKEGGRALLADLASTAVSGTLARALASMSASIAQHLAVLPDIARGPA